MFPTIARIVTLAIGALLLAALIYGVVLNGFGLFGPPGNTTALTPDGPPRVVTTRIDPGVAGARGPAPKADRADRVEVPRPPGQPATEPEAAPAEAVPPDDAQPALPEPMRVARDVTPPNVLSRPTSPYREPVTEETQAEQEIEEAPRRRYHRVVVEDAGTLKAGAVTIRLAGIAPVAAERTCTDEGGRDWPCGRVAVAALRMLIRHRAIDCAVVSEAGEAIEATCSAGLQDINGWLVDQGWAEALPGAGYDEEAEAARREKRGVHLAEWQDKGAGEAGLSLSAFTAPAIPGDGSPVGGAPTGSAPTGTPAGASDVVARPVEGAVDQGAGLGDAIEGDE